MKLITSDIKLADVIHENYLLIPVINRFGIRLGFGDKTVKTICTEHQIDTDFFLTIVNAFNNENYLPEKKLQTFNVLTLANYLRKTHQYYLYTQIPLIEKTIAELISSCKEECEKLQVVRRFFLDYKKELEAHIQREEVFTYPYIEKLHSLYHEKFDRKSFLEISKKYSMKKFYEEHDNVDEKLYDLQNILIKYLNGNFDESLCNIIIFELFRLEKDLKDHNHIEDMVLKPMVEEIEEALTHLN